MHLSTMARRMINTHRYRVFFSSAVLAASKDCLWNDVRPRQKKGPRTHQKASAGDRGWTYATTCLHEYHVVRIIEFLQRRRTYLRVSKVMALVSDVTRHKMLT